MGVLVFEMKATCACVHWLACPCQCLLLVSVCLCLLQRHVIHLHQPGRSRKLQAAFCIRQSLSCEDAEELLEMLMSNLRLYRQ